MSVLSPIKPFENMAKALFRPLQSRRNRTPSPVSRRSLFDFFKAKRSQDEELVEVPAPVVDDVGSKMLSDFVFLRTYAEMKDNGQKETFEETVNRCRAMHLEKFPHLKAEITEAFKSVHARQVVPSMRSMQFAGSAITKCNQRMFNCSFCAIESFRDCADALYLLCCGCGVGYSVQRHHVAKLPVITVPDIQPSESFIIADSKEGWADSLVELGKNPLRKFDFSHIREKGALLSSGGRASGPESLIKMHKNIRAILLGALDRKLTQLEVHDIMCHIGDLVVCGGVRRSALIALFSADDEEMLTCKSGEWWVSHPHRARANISAVLLRDDPNFAQQLRHALDRCFASGCGEPGVYLSQDKDWGANPCVEIALQNRQMCNLTEINVAACRTSEDFLRAARAAAVIGTLQSTYTNFTYIQPKWRENCEAEGLLGVSLTGMAMNWALLEDDQLMKQATKILLDTNEEWARLLGVNKAARIGCTKPSGSTSSLLGTSSGIHAAHSQYYLRRVRIETDSPLSDFLVKELGPLGEPGSGSLIEKDSFGSDVHVITLPVKMEEGSIVRSQESAVELLNRVRRVHQKWILPTHRSGVNSHNVSVTVSYKPEEKDGLIEWMLQNAKHYSGLSLLPYDGGSYLQLPFESCNEQTYKDWLNKLPSYDMLKEGLYNINWKGVEDDRVEVLACAGGTCEWGGPK